MVLSFDSSRAQGFCAVMHVCLSPCKAVRVHVAARGEDPGREQELQEGYGNIILRALSKKNQGRC